jgi:hypothetical protein
MVSESLSGVSGPLPRLTGLIRFLWRLGFGWTLRKKLAAPLELLLRFGHY